MDLPNNLSASIFTAIQRRKGENRQKLAIFLFETT